MSDLKTAIEKYGQSEAELSIDRNMFELHEADARVRRYNEGFRAALELLWPALGALQKIKTFDMESSDKTYLLIQIQGFKDCAANALTNLRETVERM